MSFFSSLFGNDKNARVLGIDIGSSSIKVVELSRKSGHPVLETYGELALGPYAGKTVGEAVQLTPDKIIEAVSDLLKEKEVNISTKLCGVAIPFASSLMAVIELPGDDKKQLADMIPLEARKYIPVPINEVALDWYIIPKDKTPDEAVDELGKPVSAKAEVLIVAIHNDTIAHYKDIVEKNQLQASFFEIEIFSTMRSVLDEGLAPVLIVDMGATSTKLYIVERGILRSSHQITRGGQAVSDEMSKSLGISFAEAEEMKRDKGLEGVINGIDVGKVMTVTLDYIFSEANHVVLAYQKKYSKNIAKVILAGGGSALRGIVDVAKKNFQAFVEAGDPFAKVLAPAFLEKVLKDTGPEFTVAVGAALRRLAELE